MSQDFNNILNLIYKIMFNQKYRLGLDLGTNSIGWAILALNDEDKPYKIIDAGVRIFSDGRNPKDGTPLSVTRREARGARRRRDRFLARRSKLINCLTRLNLMPKDEIELKKLQLLNPYELRVKALDQKLTAFELGRALFHLNQRRGFKSNRKEQLKDDQKKELTKTKQNQEELAQKIAETNSRTLGEFLYKERFLNELTTRAKPDESAIYPVRSMYQDEFLAIKNNQFDNQNLSNENWQEIEDIIFYQRPLKKQNKGFCQFINCYNDLPDWASEIFESYKKSDFKNKNARGLPRAYLALPSYQKFRILSEVNNLKILQNDSHEILLDQSQRKQIIEYLHQKKSANFLSLRKKIGFSGEEYRFNFEDNKRTGFDGNLTEILLKDEKYFGEKWHNFSLLQQDEIVEFLLEEEEDSIYQKALKDWNLQQEQAENISEIVPSNFKNGVGNLSKEILQRLVEKMTEKNCRYNEAVEELGFNHSKFRALEIKKQLDYYGKVIPASTVPVESGSKDEELYGKIANPTVHVALNQLRKVINSILKLNGNPQEIHIELARDLKISEKDKKRMISQQKKNEEENKLLDNELTKLGQVSNYDNRLKLKLFKELQNANNGVACCIYSGRVINITNLFSHEIEVEHILPFARTYDDSVGNKTISYRSHNKIKGNRSPFEAFGEEILSRAANLPKNKKWRFFEKAMDKFKDRNGFQERQLNDTRYLSRISKQYLAQICDPDKIKVANGRLTSLLGYNWGLDSILKKPEIFDPITSEVRSDNDNKESASKKPKNRDDHRHHAIDAIVIALTETSLLQQISRANSTNYDLSKIKIDPPLNYQNIRQDSIDAINNIIVSHKIDHDKNSKLHEETYYGLIKPILEMKRGKKSELFNVVYSKPLASLSESQIEKIRDPKIYQQLKEKLDNAIDKKEREDILKNFYLINNNKKVKVNNVRLVSKEARYSIITNKQKVLDKTQAKVEIKDHIKAVVGSNHHISIWQMPNLDFIKIYKLTGKKFDTAYDKLSENEKLKFNKFKQQIEKTKIWLSPDFSYAVSCASSFDAIKNNDEEFKPHPAAKLLAKIHGGDMVKIKDKDQEKIVRINKLNPASDRIVGVSHLEAGDKMKENFISYSKFIDLQLTKITVSPAGKILNSKPILKYLQNN